MTNDEFDHLLGEWVGNGEMVVAEHKGEIVEHMKIETTDLDGCYSYIRKSSIDFGSRVTLHNEMGYITVNNTNLLLSRGSYIIMDWDASLQSYRQSQGSSDSRNMVRKITFSNNSQMNWDNVMEVDHGPRGGWVTHTANTNFTRIS